MRLQGSGSVAGVVEVLGGQFTRPRLELEEGTALHGAQHPVVRQGALHILPGQTVASWGQHWHHLQNTALSTPWGTPCTLRPMAPPYHGSVPMLLPAQPGADLTLHLRWDSHGDGTAG